MSLFRFGRAIFRSVARSVDFLKRGQAKASQVPWHINGTKKVAVYHGQSKSGSLFHPSSQRSGYFLSSITRPVRHGLASTRLKVGIEYGSFLKGHRVFRLLRKGQIQGPLFAFLGFVCTDITAKTSSTPEEEKDFLKLYQWMQKGIQSTQQEIMHSQNQSEDQSSLKLCNYSIGQRLGDQSSNSAVYSATRINDNKKLAVKMLFNFGTNSNSAEIEKAFSKEKKVLCKDAIQDEESSYINIQRHPNVLPVLHSFVDEVPCLPDARASYPAALPAKYTPQGIGRNRTLFLVMPRLDCTVQEYLKAHSLSEKTSTLLLLQLLEGVSHLVDHGVAHRDMKTENLLLDMSYPGCPRLVICDFGCCLAERKHGLKMPFVTEETDRGGNVMLMAPEVITARCGQSVIIDYSKADVWSCGTIAYELFGQPNPFGYGRLDSSNYQDEELPELNTCAPVVRWVAKKLLCRNMRDRLTARHAFVILSVYLFAPSWWMRDDQLVTQRDILRWLAENSSRSLREGIGRYDNVKTTLKLSFLAKTSVNEVSMALTLLRKNESSIGDFPEKSTKKSSKASFRF